MKTAVFLCVLMVVAADRDAKITNYEFGLQEDGSYELNYETTNGIKVSGDGTSYPGSDPETGNYVMSGSYSYEWEGVTYTVTWTADENGFHPVGDHLPDYSYTREHIGTIGSVQ